MMGIYSFYQDGELLGRSCNLLTTKGKESIVNSIANRSSIAGSIALGAGVTAATVNDSYLAYESARSAITAIAPDTVNKAIIFRAILPAGIALDIREAGLYLLNGSVATSRELVAINATAGTWSTGSVVSGGRTSSNKLELSPAASSTVTSSSTAFTGDISDLQPADFVRLAVEASNGNASVKFRIGTDSSNYYEGSGSLVSGFNNISVPFSSMTKTGSPGAGLSYVAFLATANSSGSSIVGINSLRVDKFDRQNDLLISRSVLATPIVKALERNLEIEYSLGVTFS